MMPAYVVQITTPKKYILNGLWFGPKKAKKVIIFIHGLTASAFSMRSLVDALVEDKTSVLTFNNRGFEQIGGIKRIRGRKTEWIRAGAAHERFEDCVDDIQGAINFARRTGTKEIFLAGHSTGCQKSVYWAAKKGKGVKGIILLAPVSDYAGARRRHGTQKLERTVAYARKLIRQGRPHELIPLSMWSEELNDAQRFLSLYTPDSVEEVFAYAQSKKVPRTLQKVRIPTLVLWAENDEFSDRPAKSIVAWFEKNLKNKHKIVIVPKVGHSFRGGEKRVAKEVAKFIKEA